MKATKKILPSRAPFNLKIDSFGSLDLSTHESSLGFNQFSKMVNVFKEGNRLVPRIGSSSFTETTDYNHTLNNSVEWIHRTSDANLAPKTDILFGDVVLCGSKAYILGTTNQVKEINSAGTIVTRKMGISAPKVASKTDLGNAGQESGYYVWGFEYVQIVSSVVTRRSGVRRVLRGDLSLADRPTDVFKHYSQGEVDWVLSTNHADGTAISTDTSWTHVRMYRSKMITTSEDVDTGIGSASELYLVLERDRATWTADGYKMNDAVSDTDLDDSTIVLIDGIDLVPLPSAEFGCIASGRVILGGKAITAADKSATRLIFSNAVGSAYDEVYAPLTNYIDCSTDGSSVQAVFTVGNDVVVMKPNETGVISGGKRENGYQVVDANLGVRRFGSNYGVPVFARYIEGLGVFGVNSDGELRLFDLSLNWTKNIGGFDFSSPMSNVIKATYFDNAINKYFEVKYHNGVVFFLIRSSSEDLGNINETYYGSGDFQPFYYKYSKVIPALDLRESPYWTSVSFPNVEVCKHMFKDHNDRLYIANQYGVLDISQYPNANGKNDIVPSYYLYEDPTQYWPVLTLIRSGTAVNLEGIYEFRGFNARASIDIGGHLHFNYIGLKSPLIDEDLGFNLDKKIDVFSYNDDGDISDERIKNLSTEIIGAGRHFLYYIHSNSNLQIETISFDGIQQDKVRGDFDPFNNNQAVIDSLSLQDQVFWMSRPDPLKSNSHRAKPMIEVEIV